MKSYSEIFDTSTTDIIYYDRLLKGDNKTCHDKEIQIEIIEMTTDEYLERCTFINNCSLNGVLSMIHEPNVLELIEVTKRS